MSCIATIVKPGDLIGFSSFDITGWIINIGSLGIPRFGLSHIGIVADLQGVNRLFESTTMNPEPCLIQGVPFRGAQCQDLDKRIQNYRGRVYHIPLTKELSLKDSARLTNHLVSEIGTPYDMLGAIRSGGRWFNYLESLLRPEDAASLFCSEWCAHAHEELGLLDLKNYSRYSPNGLYRMERRRGICQPRRKLKGIHDIT